MRVGSLGRCLPPDPRQTDRVADSGVGAGDRVSVSGQRRYDKQARRIEGTPGTPDSLPSPGLVTPAMSVWRGSGGRHLPRLPRRGRGGERRHTRALDRAGTRTAAHHREKVGSRDPEVHSGDPVFAGARVPVDTLVDYLEGGDTLDEFLDNFPTVSREQAIAALELMRETLVSVTL